MQKKKKKTRLFIFLIICFVLVPFLLTKGCNYIESLNQAKNSVSEPISSISEQIQPSARVYTHAHTPARTHSRSHNAGAYAHERAHTRAHNAHVYAQMYSISKANWTGTAIPDSGYVEKIYINEYFNASEILEMLNNLNYVETPFISAPIYVIFADNDLSKTFFIAQELNAEDKIYNFVLYNLLEDKGTQIGMFTYFEGEASFGAISTEIDIETIGVSNVQGIPVGQQNNLLSSLFSITPFEQSSNNELSIGNLFAQIGNAIIIFGGAVVNVFISMEPIFWNEGPTLIFILLIASVSFALVFWGIELLISLIGVFKTKRKKKK